MYSNAVVHATGVGSQDKTVIANSEALSKHSSFDAFLSAFYCMTPSSNIIFGPPCLLMDTTMSLLYIFVFVLLVSCPVARAFVASGWQEAASAQEVGRGRHISAFSTGFVAPAGTAERKGSKARDFRRERACRRAARRPERRIHSPGRDQKVAPLSALNPDTVYSAKEWIAGVAGGSVGVLGTLIQLELKQEALRSRRNCPYCNGSGKLVCAMCCSAGTFTMKLPGAETYSTLPCPGCSGKRYITCLNCRGDGRAVPRELDRKTGEAVDLRLEEIGMGSVGQ